MTTFLISLASCDVVRFCRLDGGDIGLARCVEALLLPPRGLPPVFGSGTFLGIARAARGSAALMSAG